MKLQIRQVKIPNWFAAIALIAASCGATPSTVDPASDTRFPLQAEANAAEQEAEPDAPLFADLVAESGPSSYDPTPRSALGLVDRRLASGGSLVTGALELFRESPLEVRFLVDGVLAGPAAPGLIVVFKSSACCLEALAGSEQLVEAGGGVVALLDSEGAVTNLGVERSDGSWLEAGAFFNLSVLLNADWRGVVISDECGGSPIPTGSSTLDALAHYAGEASLRADRELDLALVEMAEKLADDYGSVTTESGEARSVDEGSILRQLHEGVDPTVVEMAAAVPLTVRGDGTAKGDPAPDLLVFVDRETGRGLGSMSVRDHDTTVWIGAPGTASALLVYRVSPTDIVLGCDSYLPDAQAAAVVALTEPQQVIPASDVLDGSATAESTVE